MNKDHCDLTGQEPFGLTCKQDFSQIWGLNRKIENCNVCNFRLLPAKTNQKNSVEVKKPLQIALILDLF